MKKDDQRVHTAQAAYQIHICFMANVIAFANCDPKSMCSPAVCSVCHPAQKNLDEEKSTYGGLAQENGFDPAFLHIFLRLVKGTAKPNSLLKKSVVNMI